MFSKGLKTFFAKKPGLSRIKPRSKPPVGVEVRFSERSLPKRSKPLTSTFRDYSSRNICYSKPCLWVPVLLGLSGSTISWFLFKDISVFAEEKEEVPKVPASAELADNTDELAAIQAQLVSIMESSLDLGNLQDLATQLWTRISSMEGNVFTEMAHTQLLSSGQVDDAIDKLLKMLEIGRDRRELGKSLALAYILKGQYHLALPFLQEAIWDNPNDPQLYLHQSNILIRLQKYGEAYESLEKALILNPSLTNAVNARNDMMKKIGLSPNTPTYFHIQGVIHYDLGLYKESYQFYKKALELDPNHNDSSYNAMVVKHMLDQQGQHQKQGFDPIPARLLPIVTHYEYATMAEAVYNNTAKAFPPKDWKLWLTSNDVSDCNGVYSRDGFFGAVYVNHKKKQIVLALQGSKATNDIISCIHLVFNNVDRQWLCAKVFGEHVKQLISQDDVLKDYGLSFTGHSLGAAQAEFLSYLFNEKAVTFESPGVFDLLTDLTHGRAANLNPKTDFKVTAFMPRANIINTAKTHVGELIRIYPPLPPKPIKAENAEVILATIETIKKITDVLALSSFDNLVSSPFGRETLKLLEESELMILETAYWHSMVRICQAMRHEYETGIPIKQRTILKWPRTENFYLFWRVARDCGGEVDEAQIGEINRQSLLAANYKVVDRQMNQVPLSQFSRSEQRFLREYRRNPGAFESSCNDLDRRILAKFSIGYDHVEINVGLSPEHFRDYVKWKAAQVGSATNSSLLTFSPLF